MNRKFLSPVFWAFVVFGLGAALHTQAALFWERTALAVPADPKRPTVEAVFHFKNTGDSLAVIRSVDTDCDCTVPKLAKQQYAPGESGELRLVFTVGARTGRQEKVIKVHLLDDPAPLAELRLIVDIPDAPVRFRTQSLGWEIGDVAEEKSLDIFLADPIRDSIEGATSSEPAFTVRLVPGAAPGQNRLLVRPTGTTSPVSAPLRVVARVDGQRRIFVLSAAVR